MGEGGSYNPATFGFVGGLPGAGGGGTSQEDRTARRLEALVGLLLDAQLRSGTKQPFVVLDQERQAEEIACKTDRLPQFCIVTSMDAPLGKS